MTDVDYLITKLRSQERMYNRIDAGTGFGWDKDADNIHEAIRLIKAYRAAWKRMKRSIPVRCGSVSSTHAVAGEHIESMILSDISAIERSTIMVDDEPEEPKHEGLIEANGTV